MKSFKTAVPNIRLNQSLRARVMTFTGTLFLVLTLLIVASILFFVFTTEQNTWRARQNEAAENAASKVSDYLQTNETLLFWLDKYEFDEIRRNPDFLQEILKDNPSFLEITFVDKRGVPIADASRGQPTLANQFTILQSEWFRLASSGQKNYTRVQTSPQNESYIIFAIPSQHGGVLAAQIQMDSLWETVAQIHFGEAGIIYIVNQNGQVIAHPNREVVLSNQTITGAPLFTAILESPGQKWIGSATNFSGVKVVVVSSSIELTDWIIISELPQEEAFATSRQASILIPIGIVILMVVSMFSFRRILNQQILQPLNLLRDGAHRIGQDDLSYRISFRRSDEFGEVIAVFNDMAADLEKQRESLKIYAAELETRVHERTVELTLSNENLVREVSERKAAEEKVLASLYEKEILLKEIHHRVKNNLQIISSLLSLQSEKIKDTSTLRALRDSQARVRSMALIHQKLYQSKNLAKIEFGEYVQSLSRDLFRSYQRTLGDIQLKIQADEVLLDLDYAVPCGLILNELMTNALKYAFPNGRNGTLQVELRAGDDHTISLRVTDDGVGLPEDLDIANIKSLGLQLINGLTKQMNGRLEVGNSAGTDIHVSFKY